MTDPILAKVRDSGATRESPLRLHGADFKAALRLYEEDKLGKVGSMFYPLPAPLDARELRALTNCDDTVPDAGFRLGETVFWLFDGLIGWERDDGKRPEAFSPAEVGCMQRLAAMVEPAPSGAGEDR